VSFQSLPTIQRLKNIDTYGDALKRDPPAVVKSVMDDVHFTLRFSFVNRRFGSEPSHLCFDRMTSDGRIYRTTVLLKDPISVSPAEAPELLKSVKQIMDQLIQGGFKSSDIQKMDFRISIDN